jgi:DNA adenine methylase
MKPLYMWAGGKTKMIPKYQVSPGLPYSGYDTFVEPFFGGGAMMIHIAENCPNIKRFVMNDINPEIVGLYTAIKTDYDNFIKVLDQYCSAYLPLSKEDRKIYYYKVRDDYTMNYKGWGATKEAAVLYFLMKTAFNGIWQTTKTSNGRFATPCGLLKEKDSVYDSVNVKEWNIFLQKVDIYCGDWKTCVANVKSDKAFFYFDPPYRDSFTQYAQTFTDQDHIDLIDWCKAEDLNGHIVMYCNRQTEDSFYADTQGHLAIETYPITYTAGRRKHNDDGTKSAKKAEEILLYSPSLKVEQVTQTESELFAFE